MSNTKCYIEESSQKNSLIWGLERKIYADIVKRAIEIIEHAFIKCNTAKKLWFEVERWLTTRIDNKIKISDIDRIFGQG